MPNQHQLRHTDKQHLISDRLAASIGVTLEQYLTEALDQGISIEDITYTIRQVTGIKVSSQTITRWRDLYRESVA